MEKPGQNLLQHNCWTEVEEITETPTGGGDTLLDKPVGFKQAFHFTSCAHID